MGNLSLLLFIVAAALALELTSGAFSGSLCPPKSRVHSNKPACFSDADCQKYGKICCPNQHNEKSCTDRAPFVKQNANKLFAPKAQNGPGSYCNGVKCSPWQKCEPDPKTKQLECQ